MQVFNKKYWPHQFRVLPQEDPWVQTCQIERFCYDSFRSENWRNNGLYFVFKKEQDAAYFLLRWGG
jgi:hypothetical protein